MNGNEHGPWEDFAPPPTKEERGPWEDFAPQTDGLIGSEKPNIRPLSFWQTITTPLKEIPHPSFETVQKVLTFPAAFAREKLEMQPDEERPSPILEKVAQAIPSEKATAIATGAIGAGADLGSFFTSPLGISTLGIGYLPKLAQRAVALGFAGQMASQTPELARELGTELAKPEAERDYAKITNLAVSGGLNTFLAGLGAAKGLAPGKVKPTTQRTADAETIRRNQEKLSQAGQVPEGGQEAGGYDIQRPPPGPSDVAARPSAPPDTGVNALRPAVKLPTGDVVSEAPPATHAEILKDVGVPPKQIPHSDPARGFVTKDDPEILLSRKQAEKVAGVKGTAKAGGLDSQDLPAALSPKEIKSELIARLEEAVSKAPSQADLPKEQQNILESFGRLENFEGRASRIRAAKEAGLEQQTIEIPDDGTFTVWNTKEALGEVLKRAKRLQTGPGGGHPTFRQTGISKEDREWIAKQQAAQPTVESVTPLEPQSGAPLVGLGGALAEGEPKKAALAQLTDSVKTLAQSSPAHDKAQQAFDLGQYVERAKDSATQGLAGLKSAWEYTKQRLINEPVWTDYKAAVGDRGLALSESAQNSRKWVKLARKAVPKEADQEAISNYIDTGGNPDVLTQAAEQTKTRYRAGYLRAADLDPNLKTVAENAKNYFESRLQDAVDAGILEDGIEDYIHRTYEKDSPWKQGVLAELRSGIFTGRPAFAKQRAFQYDFEAERAGLHPVKSFIKRIASYEMSLNKAIADRKIVKDLTQIKMPDGRPMIDVAGSGTKIEDAEGATEATLIRPSARTTTTSDLEANRGDYKYYDHPALRRWKWATNDPNGKPIFVQGDVLVHPDAMRQIESLFGRSAVRRNPVGRLALGVGSTIKQTMLDLSLFHPTQITVHGWEHRTFKPVREIDFTDPETRGLIRGGLVVGDTHGHQLFSEGLSGSSLTKHIPIIGRRAQAYQEWLFNDYIPRLKVATGKHALARNRDSFPNLTEDQLNHLTANQMNAAFGELNYEMLGRNKTTQDLLRIALLAPDFLEARGRFTGQAATFYGREQFKALALGAVTLYLTARIVNKLLNDEYHFEPKNAFSIVHNKRAYSLRTVQGDLLHLATSPMQFLYSRLNPVYGRTAMEAVTGRDYFGRKRTGLEQIRDFAKTAVPISLRGLLNPREQKLWESFLNSVGITERRNTATDTIYKLADDFKKSAKIKGEPGEFIYDPEKDPYRPIKLALAYETPEKAAQEMAVAIRDGKTTFPQLFKYFQQYGKRPFTGSKKNDALFLKTLTTDQKKIYNDAITERQKMRENARVALTQFRQQLMRERALPAPEAQPEANPFAQ